MWEFISNSLCNENMKSESGIILCGIIMIIIGLSLFYSIQNDSDLDELFRQAKHGGTFVGLMGIGVMMAGILLYLMGREQPPTEENYEK